MKSLRLLSLALLLLRPVFALALSTDADQPIEIEADFGELDDESNRATYTGNVVAVQGSMRMTGEKLIANFTDNHDLVDVYLDGTPAHFKQTPDGGKDDIQGQAMKIEYHQDKNLLFLIDRARLNQGERLFEGYRINYDTKRSIMTGRGASSTPRNIQIPQTSGRVKLVIPPRQRDPQNGAGTVHGMTHDAPLRKPPPARAAAAPTRASPTRSSVGNGLPATDGAAREVQ